jgi:cytochrome c oxidase assembly protein subunit 15
MASNSAVAPDPRRDRRFRTAARVTLVLVYIVIIAGSVVRSTGAGMGCPDWPKCFGHYIPPTHVSELQYEQGRAFKAGHFIIHDNALWKAKRDLVATGAIDMSDWEKYTKHDYAVFNAAHTWTEYGNRLSGVLLGISSIVLVAMAWRRRSWDRASLIASVTALLTISFEGWLGALVVESNLAPVKITIHMALALVIVALVVWIVDRARDRSIALPALSRGTIAILLLCIVLTAVQTVLGTQVREQIDTVARAMGEATRGTWIAELGGQYLFHRSFAWVLLATNALLVMRMLREAQGFARTQRRVAALALLVLAAAVSGIILQELDMPAPAQPLHLMLAALTLGVQFGLLFESLRRTPAATTAPLARDRRTLERTT